MYEVCRVSGRAAELGCSGERWKRHEGECDSPPPRRDPPHL